jgi:hypothetical protein
MQINSMYAKSTKSGDLLHVVSLNASEARGSKETEKSWSFRRKDLPS